MIAMVIKAKRKGAMGISVLQRPNGSEATDAVEKPNILKEQHESIFTQRDPN